VICIYALYDPRLPEPDGRHIRYIGLSIDPFRRLEQHVYEARGDGERRRMCRWIRELLRDGVQPAVTVLNVVHTEGEAADLERRRIDQLRASGFRLTNRAPGDRKRPGPPKVNFTVALDKKMAGGLRACQAATGATVQEHIRRAIRQYLSNL
jgi:hypothetical protein